MPPAAVMLLTALLSAFASALRTRSRNRPYTPFGFASATFIHS